MKNERATLRIPRRDDRNGYIICHIWSSESKDISRRAGFSKTGITSSSGLCLTQIIAFRKGNDDAHEPTKDGPGLPPPGTDRPHEEADRASPGSISVHLLEASSTASYDQSKPLVLVSLILRRMVPPHNYIRNPLTPGHPSNSF
jgi:hypothetical protein